MTTTMTRQQLVAQLVLLCMLSFILGFSLLSGFEYWLRGSSQFFFQLGMAVVFSALLVFVIRRFLSSFRTL